MWAQAICAALGIWMMAAPAVIGFTGAAATNARIVGPAIACLAIIALWEATRGLRWVNVPMGLWLVVAPAVIGHPTAAAVNTAVVGVTVVGLSLYRGRLRHSYAGGWAALFADPKKLSP